MNKLATTPDIIKAFQQGKMVILVDDESRENEGDLIIPAQYVTPQIINFMVTHCRGLICLSLSQKKCQQLGLTQMVQNNTTPYGTAFTVSIEAATGVTTGISAYDRARTIQAAIAPNASAKDIVTPGHIFPLAAKEGGVLVRAGHTEAAMDLTMLAGLEPGAVICEILNDDGTMARLPDLYQFAEKHQLQLGSIEDLIEHRLEHESLIKLLSQREVNTPFGIFTLSCFQDQTSKEIHFALSHGEIHPEQETLVRVHDAISFMDFLIHDQLHHKVSIHQALEKISMAKTGVIILLYRQNSAQDLMARFSDSDEQTPIQNKWDPRVFGIGAQMLRALNVGKIRLLASQIKMPSMAGFGLEITCYEEI